MLSFFFLLLERFKLYLDDFVFACGSSCIPSCIYHYFSVTLINKFSLLLLLVRSRFYLLEFTTKKSLVKQVQEGIYYATWEVSATIKRIRLCFLRIYKWVSRNKLRQGMNIFWILSKRRNKKVIKQFIKLKKVTNKQNNTLVSNNSNKIWISICPPFRAYFHSCSRSLIASFFRPYLSLKFAASLIKDKWAGDLGYSFNKKRKKKFKLNS